MSDAKKTLNQWLAEYAVSHQNPTNRRIHTICVPAIFFSLMAFFWSFHISSIRASFVLIVLVSPFYFGLGKKAAGIMAIQFLVSIAILVTLPESFPIRLVSLAIFVVAWIGQFIGHKIEGKKPSFLQDLQFLLIGPLWVFFK